MTSSGEEHLLSTKFTQHFPFANRKLFPIKALNFADIYIDMFVMLSSLSCGTTWHSAGNVGRLRESMAMKKLCAYSAQLFKSLDDEGYSTG